MPTNEWTKPFEAALKRLDSESFINKFEPIGAEQLTSLPVAMGQEFLSDHLKNIVCWNSQITDLSKMILELGLYQAAKRYPSRNAYFQRLNNEDPEFSFEASEGSLTFNPPVFITGLAGVGKSVLGKVIERALGQPGTTGDHPGYAPLPIHSVVRVEIRHADNQKIILDRVAQSGPLTGSLADRMMATRKHLYRNGVSLLIVDELQFLTAGGEANKLITNVLMRLSDLGVMVVVIANFSLASAIKKRHQQDRQRLLSRPEILMPDLPDSDDWRRYLNLVNESVGDLIALDLSERSPDLFTLTFGIKRLLIRLLVIAYGMARKNKETDITWECIQSAYSSAQYSDNRSDLSDLIVAYAKQQQPKKTDLICPFEVLTSHVEDYAGAAKSAYEKLMNDRIIVSSMTVKERAKYKLLWEENIHTKKSKLKTDPGEEVENFVDYLLEKGFTQ